MFNSHLKSLLKQFDRDSNEYYLLKSKRFVLLKNASSIDWYGQEYNRKLGRYVYVMTYRELLFNIHPIIKEIYDLKEEYITFNRLKDPSLLDQRFDILVHKFLSHSSLDVRRVGRSLLKWKVEILNSFTFIHGKRISNGPIESRNNLIKLIIRNAAGYRNFSHLKARIIFCLNSFKKGAVTK